LRGHNALHPHLNGKGPGRKSSGHPKPDKQQRRRRKRLSRRLFNQKGGKQQDDHRHHLPGKQGRRIDLARKPLQTGDMRSKRNRTEERQEIAKISRMRWASPAAKAHRGDSSGQPHTPAESAQDQGHNNDIKRRNEGGIRCGRIVEPDRLEDIAEKEPAGGDRTRPQDRRLAV